PLLHPLHNAPQRPLPPGPADAAAAAEAAAASDDARARVLLPALLLLRNLSDDDGSCGGSSAAAPNPRAVVAGKLVARGILGTLVGLLGDCFLACPAVGAAAAEFLHALTAAE